MFVKLVSFTPFPSKVCGDAAALCYNGKNPSRSLEVAMNGHHESVIEHASFTFLIEGVSRVLLAQLTRHRLASYSVQSQRYCGVKMEFVTPQNVRDKQWGNTFDAVARNAFDLYQHMVEDGVPEEDARYIIPQGVTCSLMLTMNARELRHFFSLRCCTRAQWEIRQMANEMLAQCKEVAPALFSDAGPGCVRGACPEGAKSCKNTKG